MKPYYSHAGIQIFHGDCREILRHIGLQDLVLTDPPYGLGENALEEKYCEIAAKRLSQEVLEFYECEASQ